MQRFRDRHRDDLSVLLFFVISCLVIGLVFAAIKIKLLGYVVGGIILTCFLLIVGSVIYAVSIEPILNIFKKEKQFKDGLKNKKE